MLHYCVVESRCTYQYFKNKMTTCIKNKRFEMHLIDLMLLVTSEMIKI